MQPENHSEGSRSALRERTPPAPAATGTQSASRRPSISCFRATANGRQIGEFASERPNSGAAASGAPSDSAFVRWPTGCDRHRDAPYLFFHRSPCYTDRPKCDTGRAEFVSARNLESSSDVRSRRDAFRPLPDRVSCISAARARPCSTGSMPAISAARCCCASRTPTANAPPTPRSRRSSTGSPGSGSIGTATSSINSGAPRAIAKSPKACSPAVAPIIATRARRNSKRCAKRRASEGRQPRYDGRWRDRAAVARRRRASSRSSA